MIMTGKPRRDLNTKFVAEMVRCPLCRERPADQCNFLPGDSVRMRRDYEMSYHHDRLREAERTLDRYVTQAIRNDIRKHLRGMFQSDFRLHARHLIMSVWELAVASAVKRRNRTGR